MIRKLISFKVILFFLLLTSCYTTSTFKPPANWPTYELNQNDIRKYFVDNFSSLHSIEGVWHVSIDLWVESLEYSDMKGGTTNPYAHELAIIRRNRSNPNERNYVIVMMTSGNKDWDYPGRVKGSLTKIKDGVYTVDWYNNHYNKISSNFRLIGDNELSGKFQYIEDNFFILEDYVMFKVFPDQENPEQTIYSNQTPETFEALGTGMLVSNYGFILTNYHVVKNSKFIEVRFNDRSIVKDATLFAADSINDIAILDLLSFNYDDIFKYEPPFYLAPPSYIKLGQEVYTLGYPFGEILGSSPRVSSGIINSLQGIGDDPRLIQISNPIQPGNSGSPLFNSNGEFTGLVVSSLDAKTFYEYLGIIPQNVNFAIKSELIEKFLESILESFNNNSNNNYLKSKSIEDQIEILQPFVVQIYGKN